MLTTRADVKKKMMLSDRVLSAWFWIFAFIAIVFEPLYYFGCDWNGASCEYDVVANIWAIYAQWDPYFGDMRKSELLWLRVMCTIEVFVFGPCYVACAVGLAPTRPEGDHAAWLRGVALPFCGALIYSTFVYFAVEYMEATASGANLPMVVLINAPWTVLPSFLLAKCLGDERKRWHKAA